MNQGSAASARPLAVVGGANIRCPRVKIVIDEKIIVERVFSSGEREISIGSDRACEIRMDPRPLMPQQLSLLTRSQNGGWILHLHPDMTGKIVRDQKMCNDLSELPTWTDPGTPNVRELNLLDTDRVSLEIAGIKILLVLIAPPPVIQHSPKSTPAYWRSRALLLTRVILPAAVIISLALGALLGHFFLPK